MGGERVLPARRLVPRALKDEANALVCAGRCGEAVEVYRQLADLEPAEGLHRIRLGHLLSRLGRLDHALQAFREAAELYRKVGEPNRGLAACELILRICPDDPEAMRIQSELRPRRRFGLAPNDYPPARPRDAEVSGVPRGSSITPPRFGPTVQAPLCEPQLQIDSESGGPLELDDPWSMDRSSRQI